MARKRTKLRLNVICRACGQRDVLKKFPRGTKCSRCDGDQLELETDLREWIPPGWVPEGTPESSLMEKRFGWLAVIAGIAAPTEMMSAFDEIKTGRDCVSPNVPVAMVRRGSIREEEARALLNFLAHYEVTPVDREFAKLAMEAGQLRREDAESWVVKDVAGLPSAPFALRSLEEGRMQVPSVQAILEVQASHERGLRIDMHQALKRPPPSKFVSPLTRKLRTATAAFEAARQKASSQSAQWFRLTVLYAFLLSVLGLVAWAGYGWSQTSLYFANSRIYLVLCRVCGHPQTVEERAAPRCPQCNSEDHQWLRRCASCFRVQASESPFPEALELKERCKQCGGARWTPPYRFTKESGFGQ